MTLVVNSTSVIVLTALNLYYTHILGVKFTMYLICSPIHEYLDFGDVLGQVHKTLGILVDSANPDRIG